MKKKIRINGAPSVISQLAFDYGVWGRKIMQDVEFINQILFCDEPLFDLFIVLARHPGYPLNHFFNIFIF